MDELGREGDRAAVILGAAHLDVMLELDRPGFRYFPARVYAVKE